MKTLLPLLLILASSLSNAQSNSVNLDCPNCNYPPVPASTNGDFTFAEATRFFMNAKTISPDDLIGTWKHIAGARGTDAFGASFLMGYNENGIHAPGNAMMTMEVASTNIPSGSFGQPAQVKKTITIKALGPDPQGPFDLMVNEVGQACFSTNAYNSTVYHTRTYFSWECRSSPNDQSKILCAVTFNSNGVNVPPEQRPWDGKISFYMGFARIQ